MSSRWTGGRQAVWDHHQHGALRRSISLDDILGTETPHFGAGGSLASAIIGFSLPVIRVSTLSSAGLRAGLVHLMPRFYPSAHMSLGGSCSRYI